MEKTAIVVGNGNVGALVGVALNRLFPGKIHFIGSKGPTAQSVHYRWRGEETETKFAAPDRAAIANAGVVFVCVKAYHLNKLMEQTEASFAPGTPFIVLCNGFIEDDMVTLQSRFPGVLMRQGMVMYGAKRDDALVYHFSDNGLIVWGPAGKRTDPVTSVEAKILEAMPATGFNFQFDPSVMLRVKTKWVLNAVLNTLCAEKRLPKNKEILKYSSEMDAYFKEAYACAQDLWGKWEISESAVWEQLMILVRDTSENENSMARDVRFGRKTESEYIAGAAQRFGAKYPSLTAAHKRIEASAT
jgi:2-dehydropantoate 2-reductase